MMFSKKFLPTFSILILVGIPLCLLGACVSSLPAPVAPYQQEGGVEFSVVLPNVESVAIVGDFNDWSHTSHYLVREDGDRWSIVLPLTSGEHVFMFVVNGKQWVVPPVADDYVDDGFGNKNGVLVVR